MISGSYFAYQIQNFHASLQPHPPPIGYPSNLKRNKERKSCILAHQIQKFLGQGAIPCKRLGQSLGMLAATSAPIMSMLKGFPKSLCRVGPYGWSAYAYNIGVDPGPGWGVGIYSLQYLTGGGLWVYAIIPHIVKKLTIFWIIFTNM